MERAPLTVVRLGGGAPARLRRCMHLRSGSSRQQSAGAGEPSGSRLDRAAASREKRDDTTMGVEHLWLERHSQLGRDRRQAAGQSRLCPRRRPASPSVISCIVRVSCVRSLVRARAARRSPQPQRRGDGQTHSTATTEASRAGRRMPHHWCIPHRAEAAQHQQSRVARCGRFDAPLRQSQRRWQIQSAAEHRRRPTPVHSNRSMR